jgi:hypothetical protein
MFLRLRHVLLLARDLIGNALENRQFLPLVIVVLLLLLGFVIVSGQAAAPFIYTIF